jgi:hypothetical protein
MTNIFPSLHFHLYFINFYEDTGMKIQSGCGLDIWGLISGTSYHIVFVCVTVSEAAATLAGKTLIKGDADLKMYLYVR